MGTHSVERTLVALVAVLLLYLYAASAQTVPDQAGHRKLLQLATADLGGLCGPDFNARCPAGQCCSWWDFCGTSSWHCGDGCQVGYGSCSGTAATPSPSPSTSQINMSLPVAVNGSCGAAAQQRCPPGNCCSTTNWCGSTPTHCGTGCQPLYGLCNSTAVSSPVPSPGPVPVSSPAPATQSPCAIWRSNTVLIYACATEPSSITNGSVFKVPSYYTHITQSRYSQTLNGQPKFDITLSFTNSKGYTFYTTGSAKWINNKHYYYNTFYLEIEGKYSVKLTVDKKGVSGCPASTKFNLTAFHVYAAPSKSSLALNANGTDVVGAITLGTQLTVVAKLMSAATADFPYEWPVYILNNVKLTAVGSQSGVLKMPALSRQSDGRWLTKYTPYLEETVTFTLTIDNQVASTKTVSVAGITTAFVEQFVEQYVKVDAAVMQPAADEPSSQSLGQAVELQTTAGVETELYVPVETCEGTGLSGDPVVKLLLRWYVVDPVASLIPRYNLMGAESKTVTPPKLAGSIQLQWSQFDIPLKRYLISLIPSDQTYYAELLAGTNNATANTRVLSFFVSAKSKVSSTAATDSATTIASDTKGLRGIMLNPLLNPRVDFAVEFAAPSAGPNSPGTTLEAVYGSGFTTKIVAAVAAAARVPNTDWVEAESVDGQPMALKFELWFPQSYEVDSPFQGVSAVHYFVYLLLKLPEAVIGLFVVPESQSSTPLVSNVAVTLPGRDRIDGATFLAMPSSAGAASTASALQKLGASSSTLGPQQPALPDTPGTAGANQQSVQIQLKGLVYVEVLEGDQYADAGVKVTGAQGETVTVDGPAIELCVWQDWMPQAVATDDRKLVCSLAAVKAVDTSKPTRTCAADNVYVVTYTVRSSSGSELGSVRRYVAVSARCPEPEHWCSESQACSIMGLCLQPLFPARAPTTASTPAAAAGTSYTAATDTTPPKLRLLGSGAPRLTADGAAVMIDVVDWKSVWVDPGVTAVDDVDGNVTHLVQKFGAGAVDTSVPSTPGQEWSYVIRYTAVDISGNQAPPAYRLIKVQCPSTEAYCQDPMTGNPVCSVAGVCGISAVTTDIVLQSVSVSLPAAQPQPPIISLLFPGAMEVPAGSEYDRCSADATVRDVCERGATAWDAVDGNLDDKILVCGQRWTLPDSQTQVSVAAACGVVPGKPGVYLITFSVTNSAGLAASVKRQLTLKAVCAGGSVLCPDKLTCSDAGPCLDTQPLAPAVTTFASSVPSSAIGWGSLEMALKTSLDFGAVVQVKRYSSYTPCKEGRAPTIAEPCEPGATAWFQPAVPTVAAAAAKGDLTPSIVVCPPATCLADGCAPAELQKHRFGVKGLAGCWVDTTADVGTQFNITFWAWSPTYPPTNASVTRTVVISNPCPEPAANYTCVDPGTNATLCTGVPCNQAKQLLPPSKPQPKIQLLPTDGPLYLMYGRPAPFDLGPCSSGVSNVSCGAVAWDVDGAGRATDVTRYITVTGGTDCSITNGSGGKVCRSCSVSALSSGADCLPGSYTLTYSVTSDTGMTASASRTVIIRQTGTVTGVLPLIDNVTNATAAAILATDLQNRSSKAAERAAASILIRLGSAADGLSMTDVQFLGSQLRAGVAPAANQSLYVKLSIQVPAYSLVGAVSQPSGKRLLLQSVHNTEQSHEVLNVLQTAVHSLQGLAAASSNSGYSSSFSRARIGNQGSQRQLLQSTASVSAVAAKLTALGAENVTQQSAKEVDEIQGYLASLQSSIDIVNQHINQLAINSTDLTSKIDLVFGNASDQRSEAVDTQSADSYKGLLSDWQALMSNVTLLTDQAAERFQQQHHGAQAVTTAGSDSVAALEDAVVLAERLQQQFTEQQLMLMAGSGLYEWDCDRSSSLDVGFTVARANATAVAGTSSQDATGAATGAVGRHLLTRGTGSTGSSSSSSWGGYNLPKLSAVSPGMVAASGGLELAEGPGRFVGVKGHNVMIGGLLLHTTRKKVAAGCKGGTFTARFSHRCQQHIPLITNATKASRYLSDLLAAEQNDLLPYGVDPAFLRSSKLYQPQLQGRVDWFYNESDPQQVPSSTGVPRGFYHRRLQGCADGFPILLPTEVTQHRSAVIWQYLQDGNYLDSNTRELTAELLTFNAGLELLGLSRIRFQWQDNGVIKGSVLVRSVPDLQSSSRNRHPTAVMWLLPLWIMVLWFMAYTAVKVANFRRRTAGNNKLWLKALMSSPGLLMDLTISLLMLMAVSILSSYCQGARSIPSPQAAYHVYDAVGSSHARIFMPAKTFSAAAAAQQPSSSDSSQSTTSPGSPGRWSLPDADQDFDRLADILRDVRRMAHLWDQYALLQGMVLMLLTLRLLRVWRFQAKLGLILNTLATATPQLSHLVLVILAVILAFSGLVNIAWGTHIAYASTYKAAVQETFSTMLGLGMVRVWDVTPSRQLQTLPELLLGLLTYYTLMMAFILVLMQYFMAVIGRVFIRLKREVTSSGAKSIAADILTDVLPELQLQWLQAWEMVKLQQVRKPPLLNLRRRTRRISALSISNSGSGGGPPAATSSAQKTLELFHGNEHLRHISDRQDSVQEQKDTAELVIPAHGGSINLKLLQQLLAHFVATAATPSEPAALTAASGGVGPLPGLGNNIRNSRTALARDTELAGAAGKAPSETSISAQPQLRQWLNKVLAAAQGCLLIAKEQIDGQLDGSSAAEHKQAAAVTTACLTQQLMQTLGSPQLVELQQQQVQLQELLGLVQQDVHHLHQRDEQQADPQLAAAVDEVECQEAASLSQLYSEVGAVLQALERSLTALAKWHWHASEQVSNWRQQISNTIQDLECNRAHMDSPQPAGLNINRRATVSDITLLATSNTDGMVAPVTTAATPTAVQQFGRFSSSGGDAGYSSGYSNLRHRAILRNSSTGGGQEGSSSMSQIYSSAGAPGTYSRTLPGTTHSIQGDFQSWDEPAKPHGK